MRKVSEYAVLLTAAIALAACTDDRSESSVLTDVTGQGQPVLFATAGQEPAAATRTAVGTITGDDGLRAAGFGVFAAHHGQVPYVSSNISANFMWNQEVGFDTSNSVWTYAPQKYWPGGDGEHREYLSFFAYAPYTPADGQGSGDSRCITGFSGNSAPGDPWLTYQLGGTRDDWQSAQKDLLYAFLPDQQKGDPARRIGFTFRHALATAGDAVTMGCTEGLHDRLKSVALDAAKELRLYIDRLTLNYTLLRKGRLVLNSSETPNWQKIDSEDVTTRRVVTLEAGDGLPAEGFRVATVPADGSSVSPGDPEITTDQGIFYIPLDIAGVSQTVYVSAEYRVVLGGVDAYRGVVGTTVTLDPAAGMNQNFSLTLNDNLPLSGSQDVSVMLRILDIADHTYTGAEIKPSVTVVSSDGRVLTLGTDYTLSYTDNENAATSGDPNPPTVIATGTGDYQGGLATMRFTINKAMGALNFQDAVKSVTTEGTVSNPLLNLKGTAVTVGDGDDCDVATATYHSSNPEVATVDASTGAVTLVAAGQTIITVTVTDSRNYTYPVKTASYYLTVATL